MALGALLDSGLRNLDLAPALTDIPHLSARRSWAVKLSPDPGSLGILEGAAAAMRDGARKPAMKWIMALVVMFAVAKVAMMQVNYWVIKV